MNTVLQILFNFILLACLWFQQLHIDSMQKLLTADANLTVMNAQVNVKQQQAIDELQGK